MLLTATLVRAWQAHLRASRERKRRKERLRRNRTQITHLQREELERTIACRFTGGARPACPHGLSHPGALLLFSRDGARCCLFVRASRRRPVYFPLLFFSRRGALLLVCPCVAPSIRFSLSFFWCPAALRIILFGA